MKGKTIATDNLIFFCVFFTNLKLYLMSEFSVRDEEVNYKGVVEVSQEITEIRNIQGEKRLLD